MSRVNLTKQTQKPAGTNASGPGGGSMGGSQKEVYADSYTAFLAVALVAMIIGVVVLFMEDSQLTQELGSNPLGNVPKVSGM